MVDHKIALDANIFISFDEIGLFNELLNFLGRKIKIVIMPNSVIDECCGMATRIKTLNNLVPEKNVDSALLEDINRKAKSFHQKIHQRNGADYDLIACAIQHKVTHIISNDRALIVFFDRYKRQMRETNPIKNIEALSLANFLKLIYDLDKQFWGDITIDLVKKKFVETNLNFYSDCEIDALFFTLGKSLIGQKDTLRNRNEIMEWVDTWPPQSKDMFKSYSTNVINLF